MSQLVAAACADPPTAQQAVAGMAMGAAPGVVSGALSDAGVDERFTEARLQEALTAAGRSG
jgi:uncharacterized membrane protein